MENLVDPRPAFEPLLDPRDLAAMCRVPLSTIYQWRYRRTGPKSIRVGRHLRYRRADVDAWLEEQTS